MYTLGLDNITAAPAKEGASSSSESTHQIPFEFECLPTNSHLALKKGDAMVISLVCTYHSLPYQHLTKIEEGARCFALFDSGNSFLVLDVVVIIIQ